MQQATTLMPKDDNIVCCQETKYLLIKKSPKIKNQSSFSLIIFADVKLPFNMPFEKAQQFLNISTKNFQFEAFSINDTMATLTPYSFVECTFQCF